MVPSPHLSLCKYFPGREKTKSPVTEVAVAAKYRLRRLSQLRGHYRARPSHLQSALSTDVWGPFPTVHRPQVPLGNLGRARRQAPRTHPVIRRNPGGSWVPPSPSVPLGVGQPWGGHPQSPLVSRAALVASCWREAWPGSQESWRLHHIPPYQGARAGKSAPRSQTRTESRLRARCFLTTVA